MIDILPVNILHEIFDISEELKEGYYLKEEFLDIIHHCNEIDAEKEIDRWISKCILKNIPEFIEAAGTISRWKEYIINSFIFAICSLTVGFLIGNITQNKNAIGGIVNVVALGTSFLCGCFVPFQYMPDYVLKIAHIFPTYYYVSNNELIKTMEVFNFNTIKPLLINGTLVCFFSLIFIIITNYISKKKQIIN